MHPKATGPAAIGAAALLIAAAGCASAPRAGRPILPAQSATKAALPAAAPDDGLETVITKTRHLSTVAKPAKKHLSGPTIESTDPRLAAALLTLATVPGGAAHRLVAGEYARVGVIDAAYEHYRRAVQIDPRDAAAHDGLARCWRDWGLPEVAIGDARRAVYFAPQSAEAHNTLGTVLQAVGMRAAAKDAYKRALALDPEASYVMNNLCYAELLDGRFQEARAFCQRALEADAEFAAARRNLALVHAAAGRVDLAWNELQRADTPARASYNLGIINLSRRRPAEALSAFATACRANSIDACRRATVLRQQLAHAEDEQ